MAFRIVLLGKSGSGKSSTGNSILNGTYFTVNTSPDTCTYQSEMKTNGNIRVVETPGIDLSMTKQKLKEEINSSLLLSSDPHVFLLVIRLGRFINEREKVTSWIQEIFGLEAFHNTIVLFTHADQLGEKTLEAFLDESAELRKLIRTCGNQYHALNNNDPDPNQVQILMQKIHEMVRFNSGNHYTIEMYKNIQRNNVEAQKTFVKTRSATEGDKKRKKEDNMYKMGLGKSLLIGAVVASFAAFMWSKAK